MSALQWYKGVFENISNKFKTLLAKSMALEQGKILFELNAVNYLVDLIRDCVKRFLKGGFL